MSDASFSGNLTVKLFALLALITAGSLAEAQRQFPEAAPSQFCSLSNVFIVDLAGQTTQERQRSDLVSKATPKLVEHIQTNWPRFSQIIPPSSTNTCTLTGYVIISLFPIEEGRRFFIARYVIEDKKVDESETLLDTQDIEVFVPVANEEALSPLIEQASVYIFEKFMRLSNIKK